MNGSKSTVSRQGLLAVWLVRLAMASGYGLEIQTPTINDMTDAEAVGIQLRYCYMTIHKCDQSLMLMTAIAEIMIISS